MFSEIPQHEIAPGIVNVICILVVFIFVDKKFFKFLRGPWLRAFAFRGFVLFFLFAVFEKLGVPNVTFLGGRDGGSTTPEDYLLIQITAAIISLIVFVFLSIREKSKSKRRKCSRS